MANGGIYLVIRADEARELNQETALGRAGEAPAEAVVASSSPSATRFRRSPQPQVPSTSLSLLHTRGRDTREQSGPTRRGEDAAPWSAQIRQTSARKIAPQLFSEHNGEADSTMYDCARLCPTPAPAPLPLASRPGWSGAPSLTSPLTRERVPSAPRYSIYVDADTYDSQ